jgi:hypothetical protein
MNTSGGLIVKRILAFFVTAIAALVACSAAFANSSTCGHSSGCGPGGSGQFTPPGTGANALGTPSSGSGTLPFTGLNLATIAVIAFLLLASGLVLRRVTRHQQ